MYGYKDSEEQIIAIKSSAEYWEHCRVGGVIICGRFEQDNDSSNGKEAIEWIVLKRDYKRILVISKYALVNKEYHSSNTKVTWKNCYLRSWLNGSFYNSAFSSAEKKHIIQTETWNNTKDKVFIFDERDPFIYCESDTRKCKPTQLAIAQGANVTGGYSSWWLMPSDESKSYCITPDGSLAGGDYREYTDKHSVRPVMWLKVGSNSN